MNVELLQPVRDVILPAVAPFDLAVLDHQESASFGNALFVLVNGDLRICILRDRGQIFVDFGSAAEPDTWFDSAIIMDLMGLTVSGGFHDSDLEKSLRGIASFLRANFQELQTLFGRQRFETTRSELFALQEARSIKRWGR